MAASACGPSFEARREERRAPQDDGGVYLWWARRKGAFAHPTSYFTAEKRLSNELAGTIGCAPATRASLAGGAGAGSDTVGLNGGRVAAATLVSTGFGAAAGFATAADGRGVSLASMIFGLAGIAVAVVSAFDSPTLRARLLKKPSDLASGMTDA